MKRYSTTYTMYVVAAHSLTQTQVRYQTWLKGSWFKPIYSMGITTHPPLKWREKKIKNTHDNNRFLCNRFDTHVCIAALILLAIIRYKYRDAYFKTEREKSTIYARYTRRNLWKSLANCILYKVVGGILYTLEYICNGMNQGCIAHNQSINNSSHT